MLGNAALGELAKGNIPAGGGCILCSRWSLPFSEEFDSCEGQRSLELADSVERGLAVGKAL